MFSLPVVLIFVSLFKKYYYSFPHEALMDILFLYIFILLYLKRLWFNYFQKVMCFYCKKSLVSNICIYPQFKKTKSNTETNKNITKIKYFQTIKTKPKQKTELKLK